MDSIFNMTGITSFSVFYKNDKPGGFGVEIKTDAQNVYNDMLRVISTELVGKTPSILLQELNTLTKAKNDREAHIPEEEFIKTHPIDGVEAETLLRMMALATYLWCIKKIKHDDFNGLAMIRDIEIGGTKWHLVTDDIRLKL